LLGLGFVLHAIQHPFQTVFIILSAIFVWAYFDQFFDILMPVFDQVLDQGLKVYSQLNGFDGKK
jgi:hypothetical protein